MPTKLWPRRRASSCASMTTLMAFSVKRSNMARTTMRLPAPRAARQRRWTAADREAGREAAAPSRRPAGAIPLKARMAGCCCCCCCCRRLLQRAAPTGPARTLLLVTACILFPANRTNRRTRKWLAGAEVVDRMMHATHPQPAWLAGGLPAHNPIPLQFRCYRCTQTRNFRSARTTCKRVEQPRRRSHSRRRHQGRSGLQAKSAGQPSASDHARNVCMKHASERLGCSHTVGRPQAGATVTAGQLLRCPLPRAVRGAQASGSMHRQS